MPREYRVCWNASSNINFRGATDWEPWEDDEDTDEEIQDALLKSSGPVAYGLDIALGASGFEWWVETREATS